MPSIEVLPIAPDYAAGASEALAQAFLSEPLTQVFFPEGEGGRLEKLRALFGWAIRYRLLAGLPAFVAVSESKVLGACTLRLPNQERPHPAADAMWDEFAPLIGLEADARLESYGEIQKRYLPEASHHYLVAIGVLPEYQGQGIGGMLMRKAIEFAESDPTSSGIALDTGSATNVAIYERYGFEQYAEEPFGAATIRFLFRLNSSGE